MELSVKELSSWAQTKAYFRSLGTQMGQVRTLKGLGQGAFQTTNGSMVVRKDWKVLLVDTARPARSVRRAAHQLRGCGRDGQRCDPRLLGRRLIARRVGRPRPGRSGNVLGRTVNETVEDRTGSSPGSASVLASAPRTRCSGPG